MAQIETMPRRIAVTQDLIERHHAGVWRYLRFLGAPPASADDLTQETFLALLERPPEARGEAALAAWLRVCARRAFATAGQRARRAVPIEDVDAIEAFWCEHAADGGDERAAALRACVALLDERERRAVVMRYGERIGWEEIGRQLGLAEQGVKSLLRRLRARLRACVERKLA